MKKAILLTAALVMLAAGAGAQAQEKSRKFWVGGSVSINNSDRSERNEDTKGFTVSPELGYSFSDRWAAGLRFSIGRQRQHSESSYNNMLISDSKTNSLGFAPFARYTALKWKAFSVFIDGGFSYTNSKSDRKEFDEDEGVERYHNSSNSDQYGIFIEPGVSFRLSRCISLTGRFQFFNGYFGKMQTNTKRVNQDPTKDEQNSSTVGLNNPFSPFNIGVGFNINF